MIKLNIFLSDTTTLTDVLYNQNLLESEKEIISCGKLNELKVIVLRHFILINENLSFIIQIHKKILKQDSIKIIKLFNKEN